MTRRETIRDRGLCAQGGQSRTIDEWREWDEMFFPTATGLRLREIVAEVDEYCAQCPVRRECAAEALETRAVGIAAGVLVPEAGQKRHAWAHLAEIAGVDAPEVSARPTTRGRVGKIPHDVVQEIRAARSRGATYPELVARFKIPRSTVMGIAQRRTYKEVV